MHTIQLTESDNKKLASPLFSAGKSKNMLVGLLLAVATLLLYNPVSRFHFINYDDNGYVTSNFHVRGGISWKNVKWAFTTFDNSNWHPLTWLSHMLDCQIFGLNAAGHHYVNLLLHISIVVLLFVWLNRITGSTWKAAFVAALFAVHPLNVGSVAWIAERKNMLSTLFWFAALLAYVWYAKRVSWRRYLGVAVLFACGLMSKPMVVTLPCILLLLDFWPLQRIYPANYFTASDPPPPFPLRRFLGLVAEKAPLLLLSAASSYITIIGQRQSGALRTTFEFPFLVRLQNAAYSYVAYLGKALWPVKLTIFYPYRTFPAWKSMAALLVLVAITWLTVRLRRKHPYLIVGWFWYLITLLPVIGIIQVGDQAMADRYAYLPLIGFFIAVVWGMAELAQATHVPAYAAATAALIVLIALTMDMEKQLPFWHDSIALFSHGVDIEPRSYVAHENLAQALIARGEPTKAEPHYYALLAGEPDDPLAHFGLGTAFQAEGKFEQAAEQYELILRSVTPAQVAGNRKMMGQIIGNLAGAQEQLGKLHAAEENFVLALQFDPDFQIYTNLGNLFYKQERWEEAATAYRNSLALVRSDGAYHFLAVCLEKQNKLREAAEADRQALQISPKNVSIRKHLASVEARLNTGESR
jgi:tetratricopeptide (TPR) repeat protein